MATLTAGDVFGAYAGYYPAFGAGSLAAEIAPAGTTNILITGFTANRITWVISGDQTASLASLTHLKVDGVDYAVTSGPTYDGSGATSVEFGPYAGFSVSSSYTVEAVIGGSGDPTGTLAATESGADTASLSGTVSQPDYATLELVGTASNGGTGASYTVDLTAIAIQAGDIVIVAAGHGGTTSSAPTVTGNNAGAYNGAGAHLRANDTWDTNFRLFYAVQGATPDTSLTVARTSSGAYGGGAVVQVWRGVDTTTPLDATGTPAGTTNASRGNPPSVAPVTPGAVVIAAGAGTQTTGGSAFTVPSGMVNGVSIKVDGTTADMGVWIASASWTSGTYDPPAWTGGTTSTSSSAVAQTIALKPKIVVTATGALAATESGSDTAALAGTVAAASSTGTLAATETGSDSAALTGKVTVDGALDATEAGSDTAAVTGQVRIAGALDATESGSDTAELAGTVEAPSATGALAATETGEDSAAFAGAVPITGTLEATEAGSDTADLAGKVPVSGAMAATESGSDAAGLSGSVLVTGTLDAAESGSDAASLAGVVPIAGALAASETGTDSAVFIGEGGFAPVTGTLDATEGGSDTAALAGAVLVTGTLSASETGTDAASLAGLVPVKGAFAASDAGSDAASMAGVVPITGAMDAAEAGQDGAAFTGEGPAVTTGALAAVETGSDTAELAGSVVRGPTRRTSRHTAPVWERRIPAVSGGVRTNIATGTRAVAVPGRRPANVSRARR